MVERSSPTGIRRAPRAVSTFTATTRAPPRLEAAYARRRDDLAPVPLDVLGDGLVELPHPVARVTVTPRIGAYGRVP